MPKNQNQTIVINNFQGRLTRILNGDMNSGFAKFDSSFGYDPFTKPMNLTWLNQPTDIAGSVITDAVLAEKTLSPATNEEQVYAIGNSSRLYKIDPTQSGSTNTPLFDSPSLIGVLNNGVTSIATFNYGADIDYYLSKLWITSDSYLIQADLAGSVTGFSSVTGMTYHPEVQYQGSLFIGNGVNLQEVDATGIVINGAVLNPGLPTGMNITDLDVTPQGEYMIITASYLAPQDLTTSTARGQPYAVDAYTFYWNGVDETITAYMTLPSFPVTSLNTFLDKNYYFNQDAFGAAIYEGNQKLLTLPKNVASMPHAATPNGTFLTWLSPEMTGNNSSGAVAGTQTFTSLYYFGQLDGENPMGLWRLLRQSPNPNTSTDSSFHAPLNMMVNNSSTYKRFVAGYGKHYLSVWEINTGSGTNAYHFYRFLLQNADSANSSPVLGVYETQTQLFSKKMGISQIRVYCEPTATSNGFQIDLIGSDGNPITDGTFTYSFAAGSDETALQGALDRINFNPNCDTFYAMGVRITNTGTKNMTIKKVELDISPEGK